MPGIPGESLMRFLQRPDMQVSAPVAVNDQIGGPRAANAATQFAMELGTNTLNGNVQGNISLMFIALVVIGIMLFTFWTRGFQA